jgi:hypothetical protein
LLFSPELSLLFSPELRNPEKISECGLFLLKRGSFFSSLFSFFSSLREKEEKLFLDRVSFGFEASANLVSRGAMLSEALLVRDSRPSSKDDFESTWYDPTKATLSDFRLVSTACFKEAFLGGGEGKLEFSCSVDAEGVRLSAVVEEVVVELLAEEVRFARKGFGSVVVNDIVPSLLSCFFKHSKGVFYLDIN